MATWRTRPTPHRGSCVSPAHWTGLLMRWHVDEWGAAYSLLSDGDGLIAQGRRPWVFDNQRLLLLDGTANPEILRQFVPQLQDVPEIRVHRRARVIQVRDLTFFRGSLVEK